MVLKMFPLYFLTLVLFFAQNSNANENLQLFWNLYSAVVRGSRIIHDVSEGVGAVSKAIRNIDTFFDSSDPDPESISVIDPLPIDKSDEVLTSTDDSKSSTQNSKSSLTPQELIDTYASTVQTTEDLKAILLEDPTAPGATPPVFNGCGALGFHIRNENLPVDEMTQCCAEHDQCYRAGCKSFKRECDSKLRNCLFSKCDPKILKDKKLKNCRSAAHLLFSGTMALSAQQYEEARSTLSTTQHCKSSQKPIDKKKKTSRRRND